MALKSAYAQHSVRKIEANDSVSRPSDAKVNLTLVSNQTRPRTKRKCAGDLIQDIAFLCECPASRDSNLSPAVYNGAVKQAEVRQRLQRPHPKAVAEASAF